MSYGPIFLVVFLGLLGALAVAHGVKWLHSRYGEFVIMRNVINQIIANDQAAQRAAALAAEKKKGRP